MTGLAEALAGRWALVEADFQRFYGLDLRAQVAAEPCRRLWALVSGLPPESATWRHERLPPLEMLADAQLRHAHEMGVAQVMASLGRPARIPPPPPAVRPPGAGPERPRNVVSIAEFARRNQERVRREVT